MVSTRPSPAPAGGRVAYPSAQSYVPGDIDSSPAYHGSEPMRKTASRDSDRERMQGLQSWWRSFRDKPLATRPVTTTTSERTVFGVPLSQSIDYASVQISTSGPDGSLYVWGVIPVVVAKCGLFLKENATQVEGVFRISGSAKRMRELQAIFDTGPKYGKNIDWKSLGYSPHDVATIFRRFLTQMPESIIPVDFYNEFRDILTQHTSNEEAVREYKSLIRAMPAVNQYLLLYVLDLLSVFSKESGKNLMTAANLSLIFQPGVLSHPLHAMRPRDHVLSQQVLEFLIDNQDHFLMGMELVSVMQFFQAVLILKKPRKKKNDTASPPKSPPPPPLIPAELVPSDSDDEAPDGGYFIVEGPGLRRPMSPPLALQTKPLGLPTGTVMPIQSTPSRPTELMAPSDSDDDAPPGGFELRTSDFARNRAALLARSKSSRQSDHRSLETPSSIMRRRTLPSNRVGNSAARIRRGSEVR